MSTRRARLRVKPNIAWPPAVKPVKTTAAKPADNKDPESPTKAQLEEQITKQSTSITEKEHISSPKDDASNEKSDNNTSKSPERNTPPEKDSFKAKETSESLQSPPKRARLRRFGQVNLSSIKGSPKSSDKVGTSEGASQTVLDVPEPSNTNANTEGNDDGEGSGDSKADIKENKPLIRRSRFPKVKPNVMDAGLKRQRPSIKQPEKNERKEKESSTAAPANKTIPEIVVYPPDDKSTLESNTTSTSSSSSLSTVKSEGNQMTQLQPRPLVPRSPIKTPVSAAILSSSPAKQPNAPDKRQRAVSISEPPVVKKAKRIKVDAPTDKPPDRSTMKMRDLIRWNPINNPMKPKIKAAAAGGDNNEVVIEKENVAKDRAKPAAPVDPEISEDSNSSMPVPQLTIGPDGNIVINEKSLVVDNPDDGKGSGEEGVIDETDMVTTYGSFKKISKSKRWTNKETARFYKALGMIGIDFFMIQKLFPKRTRFDIKKKFKNEERKNKPLIDKILKEDIPFLPEVFEAPQDEPSSDEEEKKKKEPKKKGRKKGVSTKEKKGMKKEEKDGIETNENKKDKQEKPKKKATKRRVVPLNYFEDSEDEEDAMEETTNARTHGNADSPWKPPNVHENDGEVVDILMDMSSGRLPSEGNQTGKQVVRSIPVPTATQRTVLPGIQNIMTIRTQQMTQNEYNESAQPFSPSSVHTGSSAVENTESTRIVLNIQSPLNSPVHETEKPFTAERLYASPNQTHLQSGTSQDRCSEQTVSIVNQSSDQPVNQSSDQPMELQRTIFSSDNIPQGVLGSLSNIPQGQEEQYVLVTVVPEGGEETMIHIYRLQDGALTQGTDSGSELRAITGGPSTEVENL